MGGNRHIFLGDCLSPEPGDQPKFDAGVRLYRFVFFPETINHIMGEEHFFASPTTTTTNDHDHPGKKKKDLRY